jgi:hypothetical protein
MSDSLRLVGGNVEIDMYSWLSAKARGTEALAGILGFGLAEQTNFWFEGAGHGKRYRGSRMESRTIDIPLQVYARNRAELTAELSNLTRALDPVNGESRLYFGMHDNDEWFLDVVRTGRFDWKRKIDSDDRTYFRSTLSLEAGDPFWTRNRPETFETRMMAGDQTLLPKLAELRVTPATAFGTSIVENVGDTFAWPVFQVYGPTTKVTLVGPGGEVLIWEDTLLADETLTIDMRTNVVEDNTGANRYNGLGPAPRFWAIAPGQSEVTVQADTPEATTNVFAQWWPRRQAVL